MYTNLLQLTAAIEMNAAQAKKNAGLLINSLFSYFFVPKIQFFNILNLSKQRFISTYLDYSHEMSSLIFSKNTNKKVCCSYNYHFKE